MGSISKMADITAGQTTDESTATETETADETELPSVYEEIGADLERVRDAYEVYGEDSLEGLQELAELIRDEGMDVIVPAEDYRHSNGINRVLSNWGWDRGGDGVMQFRGAFYGDSDGSDEGTHNWIQARAREAGVNLPWYKIMFPDPHEDYDEDSVQVTDFDEIGLPRDDDLQDSQIFVPRWYAERFAAHVNDEGIPLPPADATKLDSGAAEYGGDDDLPFDPSDFTTDEIASKVTDIDSRDDLLALLEAEKQGDGRKTVEKRISQRLNAIGLDDSGDTGSDDAPDFDLDDLDDVPEEKKDEALKALFG